MSEELKPVYNDDQLQIYHEPEDDMIYMLFPLYQITIPFTFKEWDEFVQKINYLGIELGHLEDTPMGYVVDDIYGGEN